jgi:hypothetical protein
MSAADKHLFPSVHKGIVRAALFALVLEEHPAAKRYGAAARDILIEEAAAPDLIGDRQQGRGLHYYCSIRPDGTALAKHPLLGGYCNGKNEPAPSPLTVLESEYRTALALWRANKLPAAMQSLTRSLHMLADICCPPHSSGLTYFSRYAAAHKRYEALAAEMFWHAKTEEESAAAWAKQAVPYIPYDTLTDLMRGGSPMTGGGWRTGAFAEICNRLADSGNAELAAVLGTDENARRESVRRRVLLAIRFCTALLAAFDRDVQDDTLPVWRENRPYWLKAWHDGRLLAESPFYLHFEDDGTVIFETRGGLLLSVSVTGAVWLSARRSGLVQRFRFGCEPMLTLYPDGDQNRLLAVQRGMPCAVRRIGLLQTEYFMRQTFFLLMTEQPKNAKYIYRE